MESFLRRHRDILRTHDRVFILDDAFDPKNWLAAC